MTTLKATIEHIALNDGTSIPEGSFKEQISEMEGWTTIGVAAVALDRSTNEIAARVYEYRRTGRHWAFNRKLRPVQLRGLDWSNRNEPLNE